MAQVTLNNNPCNTNGKLPATGSQAPDFILAGVDLNDFSLENFSGKKKILSIVPSLDTPVCQASTRQFNVRAAKQANTVVLVISADLPFAMNRFCETENIDDVVSLSTMRGNSFAKDYGVLLIDGPLSGATARAVIVLDENNAVKYTELVSEITDEPNYDAALNALNG